MAEKTKKQVPASGGHVAQNIKQNQNLFLSLQARDDRLNRWRFTLLVLDHIVQQILGLGPYSKPNSGVADSPEIDFVKIAEHLPRLLVGYGKEANNAKTYLRAPQG